MANFRTRLYAPLIALVIGAPGYANAGTDMWISDSNAVLGKVDLDSGAVTIVGNNYPYTMIDLSFDPAGDLYSLNFGSALWKLDKATGARTFIGGQGLVGQVDSMVFDRNGNMYGANSTLYTMSPTTGAVTPIGNGGYNYSALDMAFAGESLYAVSPNTNSGAAELVRLDTATGTGTFVGSMGISNVYGMASNDGVHLYAVSGTSIYNVNASTGATTFLLDYSGHGLGVAYGTAFETEAMAPVPEPQSGALLALGLFAVCATRLAARHSRATGAEIEGQTT